MARGTMPAETAPERYYQRLSLNQRIQHVVLILSFVTLIVTGLALRFAEHPLAVYLVHLMGGEKARGLAHRGAALVLVSLTVYHLFYVLLAPRGYQEFRALIPGKKDATDLLQMLRYLLGMSSSPPRFGRFNYIEKFEYLAVAWGSAVMIFTWFPGRAMLVIPLWLWNVARVIHSWEAILAFLAIIIWHMYNVHLNPSSFPMSKAWLTGRISEHELSEQHPLEYEQMKAEGLIPDEGGEAER
jgi:formate dehydrogenase subunit gamma